MSALTWDAVGERIFETGVDHGVLYKPNPSGVYDTGFAWNGLTAITESPAGAESNPQFADNIVYVNLLSAETYSATIEALTYPDEFAEHDGVAEPEPGVFVGQQTRKPFGLSYRTKIGNDIEGSDYGFKLHLVWGCLAAPSEKAHNTVNDSPEVTAFSWDVSTTPVSAGVDLKPTAQLTIDSTKVDSGSLAALMLVLYGDTGVDPALPTPEEVIAFFASTPTEAHLVGTNAPSYNSGTHVVTLPSVTGVTWKINGVVKTAGAQPAMTSGQSSAITAHANAGYYITGDSDWVFDY